MFQWVTPDGLARVFIDLTYPMPSMLHALIFALCLSFWVFLLAVVIWMISLRVDVILSLRARRAGRDPKPAELVFGWAGAVTFYGALVAIGMVIVSELVLMVIPERPFEGTLRSSALWVRNVFIR